MSVRRIRAATAAAVVVTLLPLTIATSSAQAPPQADGTVSGLEGLFAPGFLLDDRNGDSHLDFVNACLALPSTPSDGEVVTAANIAARLGFETASMDIPLRRVDETTICAGPVIAIGSGARFAGPAGADLTGVEPGLGAITLLPGDQPVVHIAGGDDASTQAAGLALAARLPYLWRPDGPTLQDVVNAVAAALETGGTTADATVVHRLAFRTDTAGIDRVDVEVTVPAGQAATAARLLRDAAATPPSAAVNEASVDDAAAGDGADTPGVGPGPDESAEIAAEAFSNLRFDGVRLLRIAIKEGAGADEIVWVAHEAPPAPGGGRRPGGGDKGGLDLSNLYANGGFFSDTDGNLIPDRVDVVLSPAGDSTAATADLAARIGLEATGISIPIAKTAVEITDPESEAPLVIIGARHPLITELIDAEKLSLPELAAGEGWIQVVREAFGDRTAMVIVGADDAGLAEALDHVAGTLPHFLYRGKDRPTIEDAEEALWRTIAARDPLGQAATALYKLDTLAEEVPADNLERVDITVHAEQADAGLGDFVHARAAELFAANEINVIVDNIDVQNAQVIIDEEIDIPSEVDTFWQRFDEVVLPAVRPDQPVQLLTLLSEPPEIRAQIADRARQRLLDAGASAATEVTVLSAYKQGFSWLYDYIRPQIQGQAVGDIRIRFAEIGAPEDWPQQAMYTPTRWLLEVFPIDEVLARDMSLDLEQISFEKMPKDSPPYEVIVTGTDGSELLRETFTPRYVLRDYFDRFPDYEKARVTTGWIRAEIADTVVIDERIITDLERFWDHFQGDTLMRVYDHVMQVAEGTPRGSDAPHFGELRIDVTLSEPDYQIGVDKEQVASMEALHEEIYFSTLHFFDVMGRLATGQALSYPGRVIPIVRPKADGAAGSARITFTGFTAPAPRLTVQYTRAGERPVSLRREIPAVNIDRPTPLSARISADGVTELGFYVKVDFEQDRRAEFARRTSTRSIDSGITNGEQTRAVVDYASALLAAGMYPGYLSYAGLGDIDLTVGWEVERSSDTELTARLARGPQPSALPTITDYLPADDDWRDAPLVQWDTPMPPDEAYGVLAKMDTFAEATAYRVGESYLGKPIWAIDLMAPLAGSHWSQAKATTLKPTVIYSARQHANEVSSTSHVLKLGEIILTSDEYPGALDKVNIVIHPITNPDGAQLAYDLHQITPDHMLHAGYLGALGVDVTSGQGGVDPIYPETNIRPLLWNTWLPDLFLNPHGYPSHEWVQVFSEYAAWVRTRATEQRGWWGMRGWFMPGFSYLDDPDYPDHKTAAFEIRDRITAKINAAASIAALNDRAYDRYRRYTYAWDPDAFKVDFSDDVLIYTPIKGGTARNGTMSNPRVTVWSGTTEAPDETAYGEWLELVATGGLQWDRALLEYLLEGNHVIERSEDAFGSGMTFKIHRPRPATAPDDESTTGDGR